MNHQQRTALAQELTKYLLTRHKDITAISIQGSTAKGEDREHSDLEMAAITRGDSDIDCYYTVYDDIVVQVEFMSEAEARRRVAITDSNWPFSADGWISSHSMYDEKGLLPELASLAARPEEKDIEAAMRRTMTEMYENLCKMRNHSIGKEGDMVRFNSSMLAYNVARFVSLLNRQCFNGTRNLLTKPKDFKKLPRGFWELYPGLLGVSESTEKLIDHAEHLFSSCSELWLSEGHGPLNAKTLEEAMSLGRIMEKR